MDVAIDMINISSPANWHSWHDHSLVDEKAQPNANIIYHLQSDGKITYQKGGWAYGSRTEFVDRPALCYKSNVPGIDHTKFPLSFEDYDGRVVHYIIVEQTLARKLRDYAEKYTIVK